MSEGRGPARLRRFLAVLVLAGLTAAVAASGAAAHATLLRSDPADGSTVDAAPETVRLWFDEELVPRFSGAEVLDARGNAVPGVRLEVVEADKLIVLTLPDELRHGLYTIDWKVLSAEDAHFRRGIVVLGVGAGLRASPGAAERSRDDVSAVDVVLRWANVGTLAFLVGSLAVSWFVFGPLAGGDTQAAASARRARRRLLTWSAAAAAFGATLGVGLLARQAATLAEAGPESALLDVARDFLLDTRSGSLLLAREGLLLGCLGVLLVGRRRSPAAAIRVAAGLAVAVAAVEVLGGHAASISPNTGLVVAVATGHVLGAGLWIGGLAAGLVALWPLIGAERRKESAALARAAWRRFGVLAGVGVAVLAASGLYYAGRQVASIDALLTTLYGQALLAKIGLMLAAGAIGAVNGAILRRGRTNLPLRRLRFLLALELSLGVAVLAAVGVLTAGVPPRGPEFAPAPRTEAVPTSMSRTAKDVLVTMTARPNRAGPNVFQVIAASSRRPPPAEITGVTLRFRGPGGASEQAALFEVEPGRYRTSGSYLTEAGTWRVDVEVKRTGTADVAAVFDWQVAPPAGRSVLVSDKPIGPIFTTAAIIIVVLGIGLAPWILRRRRHPGWDAREPRLAPARNLP